eukprot:COSAG06_NODE_135_length_22418_cov_9.162104_7_plen_300_part_00
MEQRHAAAQHRFGKGKTEDDWIPSDCCRPSNVAGLIEKAKGEAEAMIAKTDGLSGTLADLVKRESQPAADDQTVTHRWVPDPTYVDPSAILVEPHTRDMSDLTGLPQEICDLTGLSAEVVGHDDRVSEEVTASSAGPYSAILSFRAGWGTTGTFGFLANAQFCPGFACPMTDMFDPNGYSGPELTPDVAQLLIYRSDMGFNTQLNDGGGDFAPVEEFAVVTWSCGANVTDCAGWSSSTQELDWASRQVGMGHEDYDTEGGSNSEDFDIDLRRPIDEGRVLGAGYNDGVKVAAAEEVTDG